MHIRGGRWVGREGPGLWGGEAEPARPAKLIAAMPQDAKNVYFAGRNRCRLTRDGFLS